MDTIDRTIADPAGDMGTVEAGSSRADIRTGGEDSHQRRLT